MFDNISNNKKHRISRFTDTGQTQAIHPLPERRGFPLNLDKVNHKTVQAALGEHGLDVCNDILAHVKSEVELRKGGRNAIENVGAYLAECLRNGVGIMGDAERQQAAEQKKAASMAIWEKAGFESKEAYDAEMYRRQMAHYGSDDDASKPISPHCVD